MEVLQWVFIIGVSLGILSIIFTLYFLFVFISQGKRLKSLSAKRTKSKRKRKKQIEELANIARKRKRTFFQIVLFILLSVSLGGGAYYVTYYQASSLSLEDTTNISEGFYYVRDLKEVLEAIQSGGGSDEKNKQTVTFVATSLAGYSVKKANTLNTVDGQSVLNRYYQAMSELGLNVSRQASLMYTEPEVVTDLQTDVKKVLAYQNEAIKFFKVDETALQSQK